MYDEKGVFARDPVINQEYTEKQLLVIGTSCNTHHSVQKVKCFSCNDDPNDSNFSKIEWTACDYCNVWYHTTCLKKRKFENSHTPLQ